MSDKPKPIDLWFEEGTGSYWLRAGERYVRLDQSDTKKHLLFMESKMPEAIGGLTAFDTLFVRTQREKSVAYAGPLSGYPVGPMTTPDGRTALVTQAARVPEPKAATGHNWLFDVFSELIPDTAAFMRVAYWLRQSYVSLRGHTFAPGQMVWFCGPAGSGKTFAVIAVSELLGGRRARAFDWLMGKTSHNGELAGAETWFIDDDDSQTDAKARRSFGNAIKRSTVSSDLRIRKMHTEAVNLPTFRRLVGAVNLDAEDMAILPVMGESIRDKVMPVECAAVSSKLLGEDRLENIRKLREALPGFAAWLLKLRIPEKLKDTRFGVVAYHAPKIMERLTELAPETRLVALIDEVLFPAGHKMVEWNGPAEQLERELRNSPFGFAVDKLLTFSSAAGVYLARLETQDPVRFSATMVNGKRRWHIKAPAK